MCARVWVPVYVHVCRCLCVHVYMCMCVCMRMCVFPFTAQPQPPVMEPADPHSACPSVQRLFSQHSGSARAGPGLPLCRIPKGPRLVLSTESACGPYTTDQTQGAYRDPPAIHRWGQVGLGWVFTPLLDRPRPARAPPGVQNPGARKDKRAAGEPVPDEQPLRPPPTSPPGSSHRREGVTRGRPPRSAQEGQHKGH